MIWGVKMPVICHVLTNYCPQVPSFHHCLSSHTQEALMGFFFLYHVNRELRIFLLRPDEFPQRRFLRTDDSCGPAGLRSAGFLTSCAHWALQVPSEISPSAQTSFCHLFWFTHGDLRGRKKKKSISEMQDYRNITPCLMINILIDIFHKITEIIGLLDFFFYILSRIKPPIELDYFTV